MTKFIRKLLKKVSYTNVLSDTTNNICVEVLACDQIKQKLEKHPIDKLIYINSIFSLIR